jgi:hypothetical protein
MYEELAQYINLFTEALLFRGQMLVSINDLYAINMLFQLRIGTIHGIE